ncbi:MAG: SUMF1/EgtB/PvdO family nonheme iron enzyme [Bacteroidota bacterium]
MHHPHMTLSPLLTLSNLDDHMIPILKGTFKMGGEIYSDEKPIHSVTLTQDYLLCRYPVTQSLWEAVMGSNPSKFKGAMRPVERVNWYEAVVFCNQLSIAQGLSPAYLIDQQSQDPQNENTYDEMKWTVKRIVGANGYRLPTEAEWEYAARGGEKAQTYQYAGSPDLNQVGWYDENSHDETQVVGQKRPNRLGLYDLSGNVYEWCWDWYVAYPEQSQIDPTGPQGGSGRVLRGGSWYDYADSCRVANRDRFFNPDSRHLLIGFRLARNL